MKERISETILMVLRFLTPLRLAVIAAVVIFFWFLVLGDQGVYQLRQLLEMKNKLTEERKQLNDEIDRLAEEKKMLEDPSKLEMVIRTELGFIRPGEVLFEEKAGD